MRTKLVTALAALFVCALVVTNPLVADAARQITGQDIRDGSVTSRDVKNGSLVAKDFRAGKAPSGPAGPAGAAGVDGLPGADGLRVVERGWFDSEVQPTVSVLEGGFQLIGDPVTATLTPSMWVEVDVQVALGSTLGSDTDLGICGDLGDGALLLANEYLTVRVTDRDSFAMTALFRVDETAEVSFGPCVGNGNNRPGTYHALDDNDWVNGDYIVTRGPGTGERPATGPRTLLRPERAKG